MTFGDLKVIGRSGKDNFGQALWTCRCKCGNVKDVLGGSLRTGHTSSCGCRNLRTPHNFQDLTGQKFGMLTVLHRSEDRGRNARWICKCDCGNQSEVAASKLRTGWTSSCGCLKHRSGSSSHTWRGTGELPSSYWSTVLWGAKARDLIVEITIEEAWALYESQGGLCALSGVPLCFLMGSKRTTSGSQTASLDRIDSSLGYLKDNVQWIHKDVQYMKMDLPENRFIELCEGVAFISSLHRRQRN